jgi:MFS family permease
MAGINMIIPELPAYLTSIGGAEFKGLIISLFALMAAFSRPFSGKLADMVGRKPVMYFGAVASVLCCALYPVIGGLVGFFTLRLIHGLSAGFKPTGDMALLADLVNDKNRGEALGLLGMSSSIGMAAGPAIGSAIANNLGLDAMFYAASVASLLSMATVYQIKESVKNTTPFRLNMLKVKWIDVYEKRVSRPSLVMVLNVYAFGMALTLIPDFSELLGLKNKGLYFTVMLVASVVARLYSGKASDRLGRAYFLKVGTLILIISMIVTALSVNVTMFIAGAVLYGISTGINSPTIFAWTVDLADPEKRGRAMSTMYIALEIGILGGALCSAWIYNNNPDNFKYAFGTAAMLAAVSYTYLFISERNLKKAAEILNAR